MLTYKEPVAGGLWGLFSSVHSMGTTLRDVHSVVATTDKAPVNVRVQAF